MTDTTMEIECIYCKNIFGEKPGNGQTGITSGICPPCLTAQFPRAGRDNKC